MEMLDKFASFSFPLTFAFGALIFSVWDSRHVEENPDKQIGIKIVLFSLCLFGAVVAVGGADALVKYALSGAKTDGLKTGLAGLVSGAAITLFVYILFVPRTNYETETGVSRMALGYAALGSGLMAMAAFSMVATNAIAGGAWAVISGSVGELLVYGGVFFVAVTKFGLLSGWSVAAPAPKMSSNANYPQSQAMPGYPPQGGMPPQGGGYPPQGGMPQGGMPPQGGGYPPQGGMPPQQGGMPPQGGGYPPQGQGGGMPPQGGGYPPQGGGGGYPPR